MEVSGRDQQDQKLYLVRNTETLLWELQRAETELWKEPPEPLLDEIAELVMKDISSWEGSATELVSLIKVEIQPHVYYKKTEHSFREIVCRTWHLIIRTTVTHGWKKK